MKGGIKIGRIFGIDVSLDYSWFFIFALITLGLTFIIFPQLSPGLSLVSYLAMGVIASVLFFASVLFHEAMHSLVAKRNGMDIEGIRLLIFGGVSELNEEPRSPGVEFKMAFAGPASSIFLGVIFLGIFFVGRNLDLGPLINVPAFWLGYVNLLLGVFNLLPGFPLDGGRVFRSAVWYLTGNLRRATGIATALGKGIAYAMILVGVLGPFIGNLNLLWFVFIGWYLLRAADSGYRQVIFDEALEGVMVGQAMTQNPETVDPNISIEEMVKDHFMQHRWVAYPVVENDHVEGIITIDSLNNLPRRSWKRKRVRDVMQPLSTEIVTTPDTEVSAVMPKLNSTKNIGRLLVIRGGQLIGILTKTDVTKTVVRRLRSKEREKEKPAA
ncbi:MAG: site-2 protease family protein [Firmicutes bacterium]|nr:site-2 protease family protein [Bacillota bacterium]